MHLRSAHTLTPEGRPIVEALFPMPLAGNHLTPIAIRERRVIRRDRLQDDPTVPASSRQLATDLGYDSLVIIPIVITSYSIHYTKLYEGAGNPCSVVSAGLRCRASFPAKSGSFRPG